MNNKTYLFQKWIQRTVYTLSCLLLTACVQDEGNDFCINHYFFHDEHRDTTAALVLSWSDTGELRSEITVPKALFNNGIAELKRVLALPQNVYSLQSDQACRQVDVSISQNAEAITAVYTSQCGNDNRLRQLDVVLLDRVAEIDEVVVVMTTPATSKRFVINRRCEQAIFRID